MPGLIVAFILLVVGVAGVATYFTYYQQTVSYTAILIQWITVGQAKSVEYTAIQAARYILYTPQEETEYEVM